MPRRNTGCSREAVLRATVTPAPNSRWFDGHFPGQAILPGVAQIAMVQDLVAKHLGGTICLNGLRRVKFKKIVIPGEQLDIQVDCCDKDNQFFFRIFSEESEVCCGTMTWARTGQYPEPEHSQRT